MQYNNFLCKTHFNKFAMLICLHHTDIQGMKLHQLVCRKQILKFNYYSEKTNSTVKCNYKLPAFSLKALDYKPTQSPIFYLSLSHQVECAGKCQPASPIKPIFLLCAFFHATTDIPEQLLLRLCSVSALIIFRCQVKNLLSYNVYKQGR